MNIAKLHTIYSLLLAHCFTLRPEHEKQLRKVWGFTDKEIFGERVGWIQSDRELYELLEPACAQAPVKICSMPSQILQLIAANELSRLFDLEDVPGFYREEKLGECPADLDPSRRAYITPELVHWLKEALGPWRINLKFRDGLLVPYKNGTPYIVGLRIFRSVRDRQPSLLTSRGLAGGARAVAYQEAVAA